MSAFVTEAQRTAGHRVAAAASREWRRKRAVWRVELKQLRAELKDEPHKEAVPVIYSEIARVQGLLDTTKQMP